MTATDLPKNSTPSTAHSYMHKSRPSGIHPYLKRARIRAQDDAPAAQDGAAPWKLRDLCAAYGWPTGLAGGGTIAIVELGGGYLDDDVKQFCAANDIPLPNLTNISVNGAANTPGKNADADGEVALDIQVAAAAYSIATGKAANLRIYWSDDIAAAITQAAADGCDICSISWGADEAAWGADGADALEKAAAAATDRGMVVFAASGDNDSADGGPGRANVDLPASALHVVGCGGTRKTAKLEKVWNHNPGNTDGSGSGGGYSVHFTPLPGWQLGAPKGPAGTGRMVPDIAANADPDTGYLVIVAGKSEAIGGTSAVAPLYSGLFAAFGTKLGFITPALYKNRGAFNDITEGDNGAYHAGHGPDPCTGLGSPKAAKLAALFSTTVATS